MYIASKELLNNGKLFETPAVLSKTGVNALTAVGLVPPLTTSADFAPDGSRVVLLTYVAAFWADDVGGAWHRFNVPLPHQAEAIACTRDGSSVLIGGEGAHSMVYRAPAPRPSQSATPESASPSVQHSASPQAHARESGSRTPVLAIGLIAVGVLLAAGIFAVRRTRNC